MKVVLIYYLYPGTFVKQKICAHRYKINDKLRNFSSNHPRNLISYKGKNSGIAGNGNNFNTEDNLLR